MANLDWHYGRSGLAQEYLREFTHLGARALAVFAERQAGKTEFLKQDLAPEAERQGRIPVYIDVWSVREDPARGIANGLKSAALALEKPRTLDRQVTGINVSILGSGGGVQAAAKEKDIDAGEPEDDISRIGYWAGRLADAAKDKKILLMLDEAQALAAHRNGINITSAVRAAFQTHYGRFEPIFTGSSRDKLEIMFRDSKAPLYKYGNRLDFPKLDRAFVKHVAKRFRQASGGLRLNEDQALQAFESFGSKPGELIDIVQVMIRHKTADMTQAVLHKLNDERERAERVMRFQQLSALDKQVLVHVAHGRAVFAKESLENYAQVLGVESVTTSAVRRSIERLRRHELVELRQDRGEYHVSDEHLAEQLRLISPKLAADAQTEALQEYPPGEFAALENRAED